ncbi:MAG TPA: response regulator [Gemmataceae bacterium]|nr:response regulator [Gemmataceae bacterium]
MPRKRILSVGQCSADHWSISRTIEKRFLAEVVRAGTSDEAVAMLQRQAFDLVLVNRILDSDGSNGLEVVKRVQAEERLRHVPVMLVSNYEEAQQEAVGAGAVRGFGKDSLGRPSMMALLKPFLEQAEEARASSLEPKGD